MADSKPQREHQPTVDLTELRRKEAEQIVFRAKLNAYTQRLRLYDEKWDMRVDFMDTTA
jgi:hypothetical protein